MLNDKMIAVMTEINGEVAERQSLVEKMAIALLTGKNLFILGDTGQAKSYAINLFRERITGMRQFERLLSKQTDEEQLFGRLDLGSLIPGNVAASILENDATYQILMKQLATAKADFDQRPDEPDKWRSLDELTQKIEAHRRTLAVLHGNEPQVITNGKIPQSHIVFLDEIFKANDGILNSLLTALNERRYTNEGYATDIPVISFFAASNEIPNFSDPAESILRPLYDRFELKVVTEYVKDKDKRLETLAKKQLPSGAVQKTYITLDELYAMQEEVRNVTVPSSINELMDNILCELRRKGIHVSDRKYFNFAPIAQARAWLCSRDEVRSGDMGILSAYLWNTPDEIEKVKDIIKEICENPLGERIREIHSMASEAYDAFETEKTVNSGRAMVKFRTGFITLYGQIQALSNEAQSDRDTAQVQQLLDDMENISRRAHNGSGFTYATLNELAALQ